MFKNKMKQQVLYLTLIASITTACNNGGDARHQPSSQISLSSANKDNAFQTQKSGAIVEISEVISDVAEELSLGKIKFAAKFINAIGKLKNIFISDPEDAKVSEQLEEINEGLSEISSQLNGINTQVNQILDLNLSHINLLDNFMTEMFQSQLDQRIGDVYRRLLGINEKYLSFYNKLEVGTQVFPMNELKFYDYAKNLCGTDKNCTEYGSLIQALDGNRFVKTIDGGYIHRQTKDLNDLLSPLNTWWGEINQAYNLLIKVENGSVVLDEDLAMRVLAANNLIVDVDAAVFRAIQQAYYLNILQLAFVHTHNNLFQTSNGAQLIKFPYATSSNYGSPEAFKEDMLNARRYFFGFLYNKYINIFGGKKVNVNAKGEYEFDLITARPIYSSKITQAKINTKSTNDYIEGLFALNNVDSKLFDSSFHDNCTVIHSSLPKTDLNLNVGYKNEGYASGGLIAQCANGEQVHIPLIYTLVKVSNGSGLGYGKLAFSHIAYNGKLIIKEINQNILNDFQLVNYSNPDKSGGIPWPLDIKFGYYLLEQGTGSYPPKQIEEFSYVLSNGSIEFANEIQFLGAAKQLNNNLDPKFKAEKDKNVIFERDNATVNINSPVPIKYPTSNLEWTYFLKYYRITTEINSHLAWGLNDCRKAKKGKECPVTINQIGLNDEYASITPEGNIFITKYQMVPFKLNTSQLIDSVKSDSLNSDNYLHNVRLECPNKEHFSTSSICELSPDQKKLSFSNDGGFNHEVITAFEDGSKKVKIAYSKSELDIRWGYNSGSASDQFLANNQEIKIKTNYTNTTTAPHIDFIPGVNLPANSLIAVSTNPEVIGKPISWGSTNNNISGKVGKAGKTKIIFKSRNTGVTVKSIWVIVEPGPIKVEWAYRPNNQPNQIQEDGSTLVIPFEYKNSTGAPHIDFILSDLPHNDISAISTNTQIISTPWNWGEGKFSVQRVMGLSQGSSQIIFKDNKTGKTLSTLTIIAEASTRPQN